MTFGEWMDSLELLGYVSSRYYRGARAGWDAAIAQRDKLVEDVRGLRDELRTPEPILDDALVDTGRMWRETAWRATSDALDAILLAHDSPADADKRSGDHYDKEGNTFETG